MAASFIIFSGISAAYAAPTSPPLLKLVQSVTTDDGGSAVPDDWVLSANDGKNEMFFNRGGSGTFNAVPSNTAITLLASEGPGGYASNHVWSCNGGIFSEPNTITLSDGDRVTCTISSDDIAPILTLVKKVINDNGGTASADMWTLSAAASGAKSSRNFGGNGDLNGDQTASIASTVFANTVYDLTESSGPLGYTAVNNGRWDCQITYPNGIAYSVSGIVGISLAEGDTALCTITNDDDVPSIDLILPEKTSGKLNISAKIKGFDSVVPVGFSLYKIGVTNELVFSGFVSSEPYVFSISPKHLDAGASYLVTADTHDDKGKSAVNSITFDMSEK